MEPEQFYRELMQDVLVGADTAANFTDDVFAEKVADYLVEAGSAGEFYPCKYIHRGMRIDGYSANWEEGLLELYAVDYRHDPEPAVMTKAEMDQAFRRAETFFEKSCHPSFADQMEASHPAHGLARTILEHGDQIRRIRYYMLTNTRLTGTVKDIPVRTVGGREWSYRIWDIERLARTMSSGQPEEIVVDFQEMFGSRLVCLPADDGKGDVRCYLTVIPGEWLVQIYDKYGSRLLEQNVRTFLQATKTVNRGIRKTIFEEPRRFFPYNNGISATAEQLEEEREGHVTYVRSVRNLQIVNGGQTTGSLFDAFKKNKDVPIGQISVQMKLSVVRPELVSELVPKISRCANTQNRINDSDFFSNHPFHIVMENLSRRLSAPVKSGSQILTYWFYERTKGQYSNSTAYLTDARKREFLARHPKSQVIDKTDLAKYVQTFRELPHEVSLGSQKNFARFADYIGGVWSEHQKDFDERWFKQAVAAAIVFRRAEQIVLRAPWYAQGYRAQTVTYGVAMLVRKSRQEGYEPCLGLVWRDQMLSDAFEAQLLACCKLAQQAIIDGAAKNNVINVTEWAKRKACWDAVQQVSFRLSPAFLKLLKEEREARDIRHEKHAISAADAHAKVIDFGADFWKGVRRWAADSSIVSPPDLILLDIAAAIPRKSPTPKQSLRLLELKAMFSDE